MKKKSLNISAIVVSTMLISTALISPATAQSSLSSESGDFSRLESPLSVLVFGVTTAEEVAECWSERGGDSAYPVPAIAPSPTPPCPYAPITDDDIQDAVIALITSKSFLSIGSIAATIGAAAVSSAV